MVVKSRSTAARLLALPIIATFAGSWSAVTATTPALAASGKQLIGTFRIAAGSCGHGAASGSYLQMILPSGNASGPYMSNSDSTCSNQEYTLLSAGTDGGLITGEYQAAPKPPFDAHGNALAKRITATAQYEGTAFATSTEAVDPQTQRKVPVPVIYDQGGRLSGDLRSFGVTWNKQYFNQGAPKPNGTYPGSSKPVSGTYNPATGSFTLTWISQVVGGPFDKFSCAWHLSGQFVPATSSSGGTTTHGGGHSATTSGGSRSGSSTSSTTTGGSTGSSRASGQGSSGGSSSQLPASGSKGTAPVGNGVAAPQVATSQAASTNTVSRESWRASWWLIAIAIAIAVLGFGAIGALNRRVGRDAARPATAESP
jgi:hypothetical protein